MGDVPQTEVLFADTFDELGVRGGRRRRTVRGDGRAGDGRPVHRREQGDPRQRPTAHAEVVAIRRACQAISDFSLAGCVLYASCEPCPLCLSGALWARLDRVVYA
jgi:deoxycytidylate deaminase